MGPRVIRKRVFRIIYSGNEVIDVMAVSPRADWLACGGLNSAIKMIPVSGSDQGYELKGHSGKIKSLIFSYDGKFLYSAALDGKVLKWDLSARTSTDLSTDMMQITSIDLSSNNRYLAGISDQGKGTGLESGTEFRKVQDRITRKENKKYKVQTGCRIRLLWDTMMAWLKYGTLPAGRKYRNSGLILAKLMISGSTEDCRRWQLPAMTEHLSSGILMTW